jgi:hypothetical protein
VHQRDIVVNQERAALAEDAPETTVDIVRKLERAAQAGVEKGHWPRNEAWLAALAATPVQRLAQVDEQWRRANGAGARVARR